MTNALRLRAESAKPTRLLPPLERRRVEHDAELHELRAELVADAHRRHRVRIEIDVDALDLVAVALAHSGRGVVVGQRAALARFSGSGGGRGRGRDRARGNGRLAAARPLAIEHRLDHAEVLGLAEGGAAGIFLAGEKEAAAG